MARVWTIHNPHRCLLVILDADFLFCICLFHEWLGAAVASVTSDIECLCKTVLRYQKRDRREGKEKKKEEENLASRDNKEEISSRLAVRKAFGFNNVCLYMVENVFVNAEGCFFLSKQ